MNNLAIVLALIQRLHFREASQCLGRSSPMDLSPYNQNFDLGKSRQIFHHSLKEHHKISNIPKFRCEML
jgi:hypothetical protein